MEAYTPLIEPKEIQLKDGKGKVHTYILSKIPATYSREIIAKWTANALPKLGDYAINEEMMFKILSYVAVPSGKGQPLRLVTRELVDNHVPTVELLCKLEQEMSSYNWNFFLNESLSDLKERFLKILQIWLTQIMTDSFRQSSQPEKPL